MKEAEMPGGGAETVDVLIVTAVPEEYEAVLQVETGAAPGSAWDRKLGPTKLEIAFRAFRADDGHLFRVAVTLAPNMGAMETANAASPLVVAYRPRCLAMCGVCAGRRGEVQLGDLIIGDRLWTYDTGARVVEIDPQKGRVETFKADPIAYNLSAAWKQAAERFRPDPAAAWLEARPRSYDDQGDWLLARLLAGENPRDHVDRKERCADFATVVPWLRKRGWVTPSGLALTDEGRAHIEDKVLLHPDGLPERKDFAVHVGPIGTGSGLVRDAKLFDELAVRMRKVIGLEMEAAAIGAIAHLHELERMIVMKAVMDHGDHEKNDNFKGFAARASAECLIAFLRANLHPSPPEVGDVLDPVNLARPARPGPAGLLNARHAYVPFFLPGRAAFLRELEAWCAGPGEVGFQLVYGAGGMGKTRLFMHLCERLRAEGWAAGFLVKEAREERFEAVVRAARPTLVVIDYAERWPTLSRWLALAARSRSQGAGPLRVVLLSRAVGDWWEELKRSDGRLGELLADAPLRELGALGARGEERAQVFREAAARFAEERAKPVPGAVPPLEDPHFDRALYVHMAALAAVEGWETTADRLLEEVLNHEERFWWSQTSAADWRDERLFTEDARRAVTGFTLTDGASTREEGAALLERIDPRMDPKVLRKLLLLLHDLYPAAATDTDEAGYLGPLAPDLLGEAMVLRTLKAERGSAGGLLDRIFAGAGEEALRAGFTVLGILSAEHPEACGWIDRVLEGDVPGRALAAFEAAKIVGERTAYSPLGAQLSKALQRKGTADLAARLAEAGIPDRTVSLLEVAVWVTSTRLKHLPTGEDLEVQDQRAWLLNDLAEWQGNLGQREQALGSICEAIDILRKLAAERPEGFLSRLALSLDNLGCRQDDLGQYEPALAATQEAVDILRKLATERPEVFLPSLADRLHNLGVREHALRRHERALDATQEALDIRRKLAAERPEAFLPDLALSLHNLGGIEHALGHHGLALAASLESLEHYRKLVTTRPEAFQPDLARNLDNLGIIQSDLGQHEQARAWALEAVDIRRKLADARPEAFLPDLAISLDNLAATQSKLGQHEPALTLMQEAVEICRKFAAELPQTFLPSLATSLNRLSRIHSKLGQHVQALNSRLEAFEIRRKLAAAP